MDVAPDMDSDLEDWSKMFRTILEAVLVFEQTRLEEWIARSMRHDLYVPIVRARAPPSSPVSLLRLIPSTERFVG